VSTRASAYPELCLAGRHGSYTFAFLSGGALCLPAAALSLCIGKRDGAAELVVEPLPARPRSLSAIVQRAMGE